MTRNEAVKWLQGIEERYFHGGDEAYDKKRREAVRMAIEALEAWDKVRKNLDRQHLPSAECKHGEWVERNVIQDRRDATIPEWQSAKCSVCGKYHTTPYMYYFTNYDYCPNCGADMRSK